MLEEGEIISYYKMCEVEKTSLQRGMNFKINGYSIILMSLQANSPYEDEIKEDGKVLIYEGHDVPRNLAKHPKLVDQERSSPVGTLTQNGKFYDAAIQSKNKEVDFEKVKVYQKLKKGIWVYNGVFNLTDAWLQNTGEREVFKFNLEITNTSLDETNKNKSTIENLNHNRIIPTKVKLEVWKRDRGRCVECGNDKNLHFDHIIPYSKDGTSLKAENIQLLCAKHNLKKSDKII